MENQTLTTKGIDYKLFKFPVTYAREGTLFKLKSIFDLRDSYTTGLFKSIFNYTQCKLLFEESDCDVVTETLMDKIAPEVDHIINIDHTSSIYLDDQKTRIEIKFLKSALISNEYVIVATCKLKEGEVSWQNKKRSPISPTKLKSSIPASCSDLVGWTS